jgi:hypothetical protein
MNAAIEFTNFVGKKNVLCAFLYTGEKIFRLKRCYTQKTYEKFLKRLNFDYDDGYGGQELFGTIWFEDDTWAVRGEYDGSEWWEHIVRPELPKGL